MNCRQSQHSIPFIYRVSLILVLMAFSASAYATAALSNLVFSPSSVSGGLTSIGTITLSGTAPAGGFPVTLSSNRATVAQAPASVTVPAGTSRTTFTLTTSTVTADTAVTISATSGAKTVSRKFTALIATPAAVTFSPSSTYGGRTSTGTVTLSVPAIPAGIVVTLSSSSPFVTVPAGVTVPGGASSSTFPVTTSSVPATTSYGVTAADDGLSAAGSITLRPPYPASVTFSQPTTPGTGAVTGTVGLNVAAPPSGQAVTLSSNNPAAGVPTQIMVPAGIRTATFAVTSSPVDKNTAVVISAACNGTTGTGTLTLVPPSPAALAFAPRALVGGNSTVATVTLNGPTAPGGVIVQLSSGNTGAAQTPTQVVVPAGQTSATFNVTTSPAAATTYTPISASASGSSVSATLMTGDASLTANPFDTDVAFTWRFAENQVSQDIAATPTTLYPIYTDYTGRWVNIPGNKWTSGQYAEACGCWKSKRGAAPTSMPRRHGQTASSAKQRTITSPMTLVS